MHIVTASSAQFILDVITVVAVILNKVYFSSSHRVHLTESHGILRGHFSLLYFTFLWLYYQYPWITEHIFHFGHSFFFAFVVNLLWLFSINLGIFLNSEAMWASVICMPPCSQDVRLNITGLLR